MVKDEADCVGNAVAALVDVVDDLFVFQHGEDDSVRGVVDQFFDATRVQVDEDEYPFARNGVQSDALWNFIGEFVRRFADSHEWLIWQAADELLRSPDKALVSRAAIKAENQKGVDVIRPLIRNFWLTAKDGDTGTYLDRIQHYKENWKGHAPRAWRTRLTPRPVPIGLHVQDPLTGPKVFPFYAYWPNGTRVSNNEWFLDHYPARSPEQFEAKVISRSFRTSTGQRRFNGRRGRADAAFIDRKSARKERDRLDMPCLKC